MTSPTLRDEGRVQTSLDATVKRAGGVGECVLWVDAPGITEVFATSSEAQTWQFPLGSVSKFVTATALTHAGSTRDLDLTSPLRHVDQDLLRYAGVPARLTIEDVLRHRTGLSIWAFAGTSRDLPTVPLHETLLGKAQEVALHFEHLPLSRTAYSSGAFGVLELELQERFATTAADFLPELIRSFDPASTITVDQDHSSVLGHPTQGWAHPALPVPGGSLRQVAGLAQGLWGTGTDLIRILQRVGQDVRTHGPMSNIAQRRDHPRMALSVLVTGQGEETRLSHQGYVLGFNSQFVSLPHRDTHIVLLTTAPIPATDLDHLVELALTTVAPPEPNSDPRETHRRPATGTFEAEGICAHLHHDRGHLQWSAVEHLPLEWKGGHYAPASQPYPQVVPGADQCELNDGRNTWALRADSGREE